MSMYHNEKTLKFSKKPKEFPKKN